MLVGWGCKTDDSVSCHTGHLRCVFLQLESLPTPTKIPVLKQKIPQHVTVMTGLGALYSAFDLRSGADGFMTGFAFPEVLLAMLRLHSEYQEVKYGHVLEAR